MEMYRLNSGNIQQISYTVKHLISETHQQNMDQKRIIWWFLMPQYPHYHKTETQYYEICLPRHFLSLKGIISIDLSKGGMSACGGVVEAEVSYNPGWRWVPSERSSTQSPPRRGTGSAL